MRVRVKEFFNERVTKEFVEDVDTIDDVLKKYKDLYELIPPARINISREFC